MNYEWWIMNGRSFCRDVARNVSPHNVSPYNVSPHNVLSRLKQIYSLFDINIKARTTSPRSMSLS